MTPAEQADFNLWLNDKIVEEVVFSVLRAAGFAIGQARSEDQTRRWARRVVDALKGTDDKYLQTLLTNTEENSDG